MLLSTSIVWQSSIFCRPASLTVLQRVNSVLSSLLCLLVLLWIVLFPRPMLSLSERALKKVNCLNLNSYHGTRNEWWVGAGSRKEHPKNVNVNNGTTWALSWVLFCNPNCLLCNHAFLFWDCLGLFYFPPFSGRWLTFLEKHQARMIENWFHFVNWNLNLTRILFSGNFGGSLSYIIPHRNVLKRSSI